MLIESIISSYPSILWMILYPKHHSAVLTVNISSGFLMNPLYFVIQANARGK